MFPTVAALTSGCGVLEDAGVTPLDVGAFDDTPPFSGVYLDNPGSICGVLYPYDFA